MVDIQIYRSTIGCFNNSKCSRKRYSQCDSNISNNTNRCGNILCLFLISILLNGQINSDYCKTLYLKRNKMCHIYNGNIYKMNDFKMVHINKGNSNFENKYDDLLQLLNVFRPHLLSIQEANYNVESDKFFKGYKLEYNCLTKSCKMARTVVLIRDDIPYERCLQLENEYISSIWIQIYMSKTQSFYVMSAYP